MSDVQAIAPYLEPVRKSLTVERSVDEAFEIFTARMASWWPTQKFSISEDRTVDVVFEGREGGAVFEVRDDGERFEWGTVLAWEPPGRVVFAWYPGRAPETGQEVEVRFAAEGGGTRVDLEHRGWEILGDAAESTRKGYVEGWDLVFVELFGGACRL